MLREPVSRIVLFYVARCHEDWRWFLSIRTEAALLRAANEDMSSSDDSARRRLRLVKIVLE